MPGFPSLTLGLDNMWKKFKSNVIEFFIFRTRVVAVFDERDISSVFGAPAIFGTSKIIQDLWKHIVQHALIAKTGEPWKVHRNVLKKAFHGSALKAQVIIN